MNDEQQQAYRDGIETGNLRVKSELVITAFMFGVGGIVIGLLGPWFFHS